MTNVLTVIPARGGSKGLRNKNILTMCGLPLIAHTILFTDYTDVCGDVVVSTDSDQIASVAREWLPLLPYNREVCNDVLMRDPALAQDNTPIWAVLRAVLAEMEVKRDVLYDLVLLLEVTSPFRRTGDLESALEVLAQDPRADGIIATAKFNYNPIWNGFVIDERGYLDYLIATGRSVFQRQQIPEVYHHSGDFYVWRAEFVRAHADGYQSGHYLSYPTPSLRAFSIDTLEEFQWMEKLVNSGLVSLPWL